MRPTRLLLSISFVSIAIFLTYLSLARPHPRSQARAPVAGEQHGFTTFFSFQTPSVLFPPSAIISLTDDNSTFFLARPAAFGPSLPSDGLSGQLWIGSGFGDDSAVRGGQNIQAEGELGCSDIPGWAEDRPQYAGSHPGEAEVDGKDGTRATIPRSATGKGAARIPRTKIPQKGNRSPSAAAAVPRENDGTDEHLHYPLPGTALVKRKDNQQGHADIQSIQESAEIAGKVVLLSRGGCGFLEKVKWAQRRGALALIVGDNTRGGPLVNMWAHGDASNVSIPSLFTSHTTAHLLSSLIPGAGNQPEGAPDAGQASASEEGSAGKMAPGKTGVKNGKSSGTGSANNPNSNSKANSNPQSASASASNSQAAPKGSSPQKESWISSLLSSLGIRKKSEMSVDSRRPPSSGRVNWIISEDWDDAVASPKKGPKESKSASRAKPTTQSAGKQIASDDFVIGVHDWRDPDLVMPATTQCSPTSVTSTNGAVANTEPSKAGKKLAG
jgi:hypothetical protein